MVNFGTLALGHRVWRIDGVCHEHIYLVEGTRRAALIDSGSGFGSLLAVVRRLTALPVVLLLTHGHTDHAMGAGEFDEVYMSLLDTDIYRAHGERGFRMSGLAFSRAARQVTAQDYLPTADPARFHKLEEGMCFDLGGRELVTFACPGHTPGSVVFLDDATRWLFSGDACSNATFLLGPQTLSVQAYAESLGRLQRALGDGYRRVLEAHGSGELPCDIFENVRQLCGQVLAGESDRIPYEFRGYCGLLAKARQPHSLCRLDGREGNLIYREDQLWETTSV